MSRYLNTCMRNCFGACSMLTEVEEGRTVRVRGNPDHPITRGFLCPKMRDVARETRHPDRLLYPLLRSGPKGSGSFERISWKEAMKTVAQKVEEVREDPASILQFSSTGNAGLLSSGFPERFFNYLGATGVRETVCNTAGQEALRYVYGSCHGADPELIPELDLLVTWGANPAWTNLHGFSLIRRMMEQGGHYTVIDPLFTSSGRVGEHLQVRPGSDYHLAMGLIHQILESGGADRHRLRRETVGLKTLEDMVSGYEPRRVESLTGVEPASLLALAERLVSGRSLIHIGWGLQRRDEGGRAVRAIGMIPAVLGLGRRGFIYSNNDYGFDSAYLEASYLDPGRPRMNQMAAGRRLARGDFQVMFCYSANPLASLADLNTLQRGLEREDLFTVVHDLYLTDTARMADLVLPAAHFLETTDVRPSYYHRYLGYNQKTQEPRGESVSNADLFRRMAEALGLEEPALLEDDGTVLEGVLDSNPRLSGREGLFETGFCEIVPPDLNSMNTPSGRVELVSETAGREGASRFPVPPEAQELGPGEFNLISPAHRDSLRSQDHWARLHRQGEICLNSESARRLGIENISQVVAENSRGRAEFTARLDPRVPPGVALSYSSPWPSLAPGGTPNHLTSDSVQEHGGGSTYNSARVFLRPLKSGADTPPPPDGEE